MSDIVKYYIKLAENPHARKNWKDIAEAYREQGLTEESEAFNELITELFNGSTNSPSTDTQQ